MPFVSKSHSSQIIQTAKGEAKPRSYAKVIDGFEVIRSYDPQKQSFAALVSHIRYYTGVKDQKRHNEIFTYMARTLKEKYAADHSSYINYHGGQGGRKLRLHYREEPTELPDALGVNPIKDYIFTPTYAKLSLERSVTQLEALKNIFQRDPVVFLEGNSKFESGLVTELSKLNPFIEQLRDDKYGILQILEGLLEKPVGMTFLEPGWTGSNAPIGLSVKDCSPKEVVTLLERKIRKLESVADSKRESSFFETLLIRIGIG